jgi:ketosteroid isomerase-like protein
LDDRYAINVAKTELREGYKNGDVERILAVFADSFTDMTEGQPTFFGVEAKAVRRARLEKLFHGHHVEMSQVIIDIVVSGDIAIEHGWHGLTLRPKAGGPITTRRTRYMEAWWRSADGAWRIVLFLDNADQKPQLAEQVLLALRADPAAPEFDKG